MANKYVFASTRSSSPRRLTSILIFHPQKTQKKTTTLAKNKRMCIHIYAQHMCVFARSNQPAHYIYICVLFINVAVSRATLNDAVCVCVCLIFTTHIYIYIVYTQPPNHPVYRIMLTISANRVTQSALPSRRCLFIILPLGPDFLLVYMLYIPICLQVHTMSRNHSRPRVQCKCVNFRVCVHAACI